MLVKITKKQADYVHYGDGNYRCDGCKLWHPAKLCFLFDFRDVVQPWGSCDFHREGVASKDNVPHNIMSPKTAGYVENPFKTGYGCRRCEEFDRKEYKCKKVNENGEPDPGVIDPMGCCDEWEVDPVFGAI